MYKWTIIKTIKRCKQAICPGAKHLLLLTSPFCHSMHYYCEKTHQTHKKCYRGNAKLIKITAFKCMIITVVKFFFRSFVLFYSIYCLKKYYIEKEKEQPDTDTELTKSCSNKNQIKICVLQANMRRIYWLFKKEGKKIV